MGIAENLKRLRKSAQLSQAVLAKAAGVSQQLISQLERGENASTKELPKLARALKTSVYKIDENFTPEDEPLVQVPLISWVDAGNPRAADAVVDIESAPRISMPGLDPKGEWVALTVVGDSMDKVSPPDSIIFVNLKDRRKVANACYVVVDVDTGVASYKRYRPDPPRYEPASFYPEKHPTFFIRGAREPQIIGRVWKTMLTL